MLLRFWTSEQGDLRASPSFSFHLPLINWPLKIITLICRKSMSEKRLNASQFCLITAITHTCTRKTLQISLPCFLLSKSTCINFRETPCLEHIKRFIAMIVCFECEQNSGSIRPQYTMSITNLPYIRSIQWKHDWNIILIWLSACRLHLLTTIYVTRKSFCAHFS